jgi:hypothetical protein
MRVSTSMTSAIAAGSSRVKSWWWWWMIAAPAARLATASSTVWSAVCTGAPLRSGVTAASMSTAPRELLMT